MRNKSFFSVLKSNLKCAVCKDKKCRLRYTPNRRRVQYIHGTRYVTTCPKDREKHWKESLRRKLP